MNSLALGSNSNSNSNSNLTLTQLATDIKRIKVYQIDKPAQKKYRRAGKED